MRIVAAIRKGFCALFLIAAALGCARGSRGGEVMGGSPVPEQSVWESSPGVMRGYNSAYVDHVDVLSGDTGRLVPATPSEMEGLSTEFRAEIVRALGNKQAVLPVPAKGVAVIRATLLNVSSTRTLDALRPGLLVPNQMRGGGTMEVLFLDSVTGKPLKRIKDSRAGERGGYFSGLGKWDGMKKAFDEWSYLIAQQF